MLQVTIPEIELWDQGKQEFTYTKSCTLQLEHSLVSLSKWESKWKKPFVGKELNKDELLDYIRCMTITQNVDPEIYKTMPNNIVEEIKSYIDDTMTATWFSENGKVSKGHKSTGEQPTSELIYYWMIANNIPKECEKWHLNRLLTLIRICGVKNESAKPMSKKETASQYAAINAQRRKMLKSKG